jgi:hypothetical protein
MVENKEKQSKYKKKSRKLSQRRVFHESREVNNVKLHLRKQFKKVSTRLKIDDLNLEG